VVKRIFVSLLRVYLVFDFYFCKPVLVLCWSLVHSLPYILISQSLSLNHPHYQIMTWIRVADRFKKFLPLESECSLPCSKNILFVPVWSQMNQFTPFNLTSVRYIVILSFHLNLGLPSFLFLSALLTKPLLPFVFCPMPATCTAHVIHLIWFPKAPQLFLLKLLLIHL